ncbi:MAG TPA: hypothetical protein VI916_02635 [Acidimicrobiia bacterium]|nr:hypothetical protein [Acidimicrobiia bacterium]
MGLLKTFLETAAGKTIRDAQEAWDDGALTFLAQPGPLISEKDMDTGAYLLEGVAQIGWRLTAATAITVMGLPVTHLYFHRP